MFKKIMLGISLVVFIIEIVSHQLIPFYGGLLALILSSLYLLPIIFRKIKIGKLSSKSDRKRKKYEDLPLWFKILVFFGIWVGFVMFGFLLSTKVLHTTDTGIGIITAICFWIGLVVALLLAFHPSSSGKWSITLDNEIEEFYDNKDSYIGGTKSKTFIVPVEYYTIDAMLDQNKILWNKTERKALKEYDEWKVGKNIISTTLKRCPYLDAVEGSVVKVCVIYK